MEKQRKGARSFKDITEDIKDLLNKGTIESANLTEWLAVDTVLLLKNFLMDTKRQDYLDPIIIETEKLPKKTINTLNETIGLGLLQAIKENNDQELILIMSNHLSDTVRCWATYIIARDTDLDIETKLRLLQPFAADTHFGVREIAWMSVRPHLSKELETAIHILTDWTKSDNENIRRFASESIRPRGVWCEHIGILKEHPELALPILNNLKSDSSKYVRDSVGNWLNDASKTAPTFVQNLCMQWEKESPTKETAYIIKKALRTLNK